MIEPQYVAMMNGMMQETLIIGTAKHAELPGWQAAGKTGTSQDYRDGWFVGYTSQLITGVWLGNDDNSPTKRVSGGNLPVNVWSRYMKVALKDVPPSPLPGFNFRNDPGAMIPPGDIAGAKPDPIGSLLAPRETSTRERSLFERLFGG